MTTTRQGRGQGRGIKQARISSKRENHVPVGWFKYIQVVIVVQRREAAAGPGSEIIGSSGWYSEREGGRGYRQGTNREPTGNQQGTNRGSGQAAVIEGMGKNWFV
jgi:hypothetical protein